MSPFEEECGIPRTEDEKLGLIPVVGGRAENGKNSRGRTHSATQEKRGVNETTSLGAK